MVFISNVNKFFYFYALFVCCFLKLASTLVFATQSMVSTCLGVDFFFIVLFKQEGQHALLLNCFYLYDGKHFL